MESQDEALLEAVIRCDLSSVRSALAAGADPDASTLGSPALHHAVSKADRGVTLALLEAGADILMRDELGNLPLDSAIKYAREDQREEFCIWLVGLSPDAATENDHAIGLAAEHGLVRLIGVLDELGCSIEKKSGGGFTPLCSAVWSGSEAGMEKMLALGANIEAENGYGQTPLHVAVSRDNEKAVRLLLRAGANPNGSSATGYRPLHSAADRDSGEIADLLLQTGALPTYTNNDGATAWQHAIKCGAVRVLRVLEDAGAGQRMDQDRLSECLARAAREGQVGMVREMLARGADPACKTNGRTLLQQVRKGDDEVKRLILAARSGARISGNVGAAPEETSPRASARAPAL